VPQGVSGAARRGARRGLGQARVILEQLRQRLQAGRARELEQVLDHAPALQRAPPEALRALRAAAAGQRAPPACTGSRAPGDRGAGAGACRRADRAAAARCGRACARARAACRRGRGGRSKQGGLQPPSRGAHLQGRPGAAPRGRRAYRRSPIWAPYHNLQACRSKPILAQHPELQAVALAHLAPSPSLPAVALTARAAQRGARRACRRSPILAAAWLSARIWPSSAWNVPRVSSSPASMSTTCAWNASSPACTRLCSATTFWSTVAASVSSSLAALPRPG